MALNPIQISESTAAEQVAQRLINDIVTMAQRVIKLREEGLPAIPARPATTTPDGRQIPAYPGSPGVSAEALNAALGADNREALDQVRIALGLE